MAAISGTVIFAEIVPSDDLNDMATHIDTYGKGGYRSVVDLTERDAIYESRRSIGMLVHCQADDKVYTLSGGITNLDWIEASVGGGDKTPDHFIVVADIAARDALPADKRVNGMIVKVLNNGMTPATEAFYTIGGGLTNTDWVEQGNMNDPDHFLVVPDIATRDAILANNRVLGMVVKVLNNGMTPAKEEWFTLQTGLTNTDWATYELLNTVDHFVVVPDMTARDAIPPSKRVQGMVVKVLNNGATPAKEELFTLKTGVTNTDWATYELLNTLDHFLVVADIAARDAIPSNSRVNGMVVKVLNNGGTPPKEEFYKLGSGLANTDWVEQSMGGMCPADLPEFETTLEAGGTPITTTYYDNAGNLVVSTYTPTLSLDGSEKLIIEKGGVCYSITLNTLVQFINGNNVYAASEEVMAGAQYVVYE
jgi:hypothetical protein